MSWPRGPPRNKTISELAGHPGPAAAAGGAADQPQQANAAPNAAAAANAAAGAQAAANAAAGAQAAATSRQMAEILLGGGGGGGNNNNANSYVSGLSGYNSNASFWGRGHSRNMHRRQTGRWSNKEEKVYLERLEQLREIRRARVVQECATAASLFAPGDRVIFAPVGIWVHHDTTETVAEFVGMATECLADVRVIESLVHAPGLVIRRDVRELRHIQKPLRAVVQARHNLGQRRQAVRNMYEEATGGQFAGRTSPYHEISQFLESPRTQSTAPENTLPALKWKQEPKKPKNPNGSSGGGGGGGGGGDGSSQRKRRNTQKRKTIN
jgi:hypothetical protein